MQHEPDLTAGASLARARGPIVDAHGATHPERWRSRIYRSIAWWLPLSSVYLMTGANCPFCGQPACVAGSAGVGIAGAVVSLLLRGRRRRSSRTQRSPTAVDD